VACAERWRARRLKRVPPNKRMQLTREPLGGMSFTGARSGTTEQ